MQTEYIILIAYLAVWSLAMLRCYGYLWPRRTVRKAQALPEPLPADLPPLSVVIPTYEQCDDLRRHLPSMLEQDYPQDFEVIVVDMRSTDETLAYLETLESRYPNLHVARVPDTARNISLIRLALTLGIRAASHDWVVLTQPACCPASPYWLMRMGQACAGRAELQIVLGYTLFQKRFGWNALRCRFFRLWQQMLHLPYAARHGAYQAEGTNLCYRRSLFLEHRGFANHSNLLVGATDIMVNHHSTHRNTAVCLHPDAFVLQTPPNSRWWGEERLFFMETRRHFRHTVLYRLKYLGHVVLTWLFTLATLAALAGYVIRWQDYVLAGTVAALWTLHLAWRAYAFYQGSRALGTRAVMPVLPLLLHLVPWWDGLAWLRWCFTRRRVFQKKFI